MNIELKHTSFDKLMNDVIKRDGGGNKRKSIIGSGKLIFLYEAVLVTNYIEGDIIECGVFRGGSAYIMASSMHSRKKIHLFDSWEGLPEKHEKDTMSWSKGAFVYSFDKCKELLKPFDDKIIYHKGWFKDTLPDLTNEKFAVVHLDCDHYQSYMDCFNEIVPRIVDGGFLICDEKIHTKIIPGGVRIKHFDKDDELTGFGKALYEYFGDIDELNTDGREYGIVIRIER